MDGPVVVASIGFSADLIMRRIARGGVRELIAVGLDAGDNAVERVESTFNLLKVYLNSMRIPSELRIIKLRGGGEPWFPIAEARNIIAEALARSGGEGVELLLSGGPRMLVVGLLAAALSMRKDEANRIKVLVYGEGFPGRLELRLGPLASLLCLSPRDRALLELIAAGYRETSVLLEKSGLPRSTLFKKLNELERLGLIRRDGRGLWTLDEGLERLL